MNGDVLVKVIKHGEGDVRIGLAEAPNGVIGIGERKVETLRLDTNGLG